VHVEEEVSVAEIEIPEPAAAAPEPVTPVAAPEAPTPAVEKRRPRPQPEPAGDLAASWRRYEDLLAEPGEAILTIEDLLAGVPAPEPEPAALAAKPASVQAEPAAAQREPPPDAPTHVSAGPEPAAVAVEDEIVPIEDLCYSGSGAMERARIVRAEIRGVLAEEDLDRPALRDLVEELLDLVELGKEHR